MRTFIYLLFKVSCTGILSQLLFVGLALGNNVPQETKSIYKKATEAGHQNLSLADEFRYPESASENSGKRSPGLMDAVIDVSGRVISSSDGEGIPGVNILVKGSGTGTVTDVDGNYTVDVPNDDDILVFSSIGFITQEVPVNGRAVIDITLVEDLQSLDEVVVVGYGTIQKR